MKPKVGDYVEVIDWVPGYGGKWGVVLGTERIGFQTYYYVKVSFSHTDFRKGMFLSGVLRVLHIC